MNDNSPHEQEESITTFMAPVEVPIPPAPTVPSAKTRTRQQEHGDQDTTVTLAVTQPVPVADGGEPDMVYTADWRASTSTRPDDRDAEIARLNRELKRRDGVIANLTSALDTSEQRNHDLLSINDVLQAGMGPHDQYTLTNLRAGWPKLSEETRKAVALKLIDDLMEPVWSRRGYAWQSVVHVCMSQRLGPLPMEMDKVVTRNA